MRYKINETHPNFLIIDGEDNFTKGLLFPHNIFYDGEEMSLPFAMYVMKRLRNNNSLLNKLKLVTRFGPNQEYAILSYDCKDIFHNETSLCENTSYKGKVIAKTKYSTIIAVNGCYGYYLNSANNIELGDIINVAIIRNCRNKFGFYQFCEANNTEEEISIYPDESEKIEKFLSKEELQAIEDDDRKTVERVLNNIEGTTRKNINVVKEVLHLTYKPGTQSDLANFLKKNPQYFTDNNFWIGGYRDNKTNDAKLIIYDCNDVVLEIQVNDSGMWVQEFSHDRIKSNAQYLLNKNQKALVIPGSNVKFHEYNYLHEKNLHIGNNILDQLDVAKNIIPRLNTNIRTLKEKAGIEYLILKKYLTYQENKEREYNKKNAVNIVENEASITTSESNGKTALFLSGNSEVTSLFTEQDEDVCRIEIKWDKDEKPIKAELKSPQGKNGFYIDFYDEHFNIEQLRKDGFELRRRAETRHLVLQKESIDNFVYEEGQSDIFDKLNRGELVPPTPDENLVFFDSKFINVEEGNNQPLAIRKAVNVEDIFLIQGPPGTGKTSVIVEIIKQLVINHGEKVLVCSQAHSAVKNIYDRLNNVDERIKIGNIDEKETMNPDDLDEHLEFLKNNELLLKDLDTCDSIDEVSKQIENRYTYKSSACDSFKERHKYICKYYKDNKPNSSIEWIDILSELHKGLIELGDNAETFNKAKHYQSLNVVMGTCIGIGMDKSLQRSGIKFDTVIIDEAGKANLSETTVPMKLGKKYILVGDNKQLPPFMDREDISEFVKTSENELQFKDVENAISASLFEDFLEDDNFPKQSSILLNYQYRMNPDIGDYISELFYEEALKNGKGTEQQTCKLRGFPDAVTFMDTSSPSKEAYEKGNPQIGWYNPTEISFFKEKLLPRLEELIAEDPKISVGIITPYRRQRAYFMEEVRGTPLENSVHTIDSIQGSEFDVVILSLVRAFNPEYQNRTVGFLDDMRRLNVALSRAKKKLIIIGNLDTLTNEKAHSKRESDLSINPTEVFQKLRLIRDRTAQKTSLHRLMDEIKNKRVENGSIFKDCTWKWKCKEEYQTILVTLNINGNRCTFPMKVDDCFLKYETNNKKKIINVQFIEIGENGRAKFKYMPDVSISEMVKDELIRNVKAKMIKESYDKENYNARFEFEDGSDYRLGFDHRINEKHILWDLLDSQHIEYIPLFIQNLFISLDNRPYKNFNKTHKIGAKVKIKVVDDKPSKYYIVQCDEVYGKVNKLSQYSLKLGQEIEATIYNISGISNQNINFNIIQE